MSTLELTDPPPCPRCGRGVAAIVTDPKQDDYLYGGQRWTVASFPALRYSLQPCGHDVRGLSCNREGTRVTEWHVRH